MTMKYLFILGRNPELSLAEVKAFFGKELLNFSIKSNALFVNLENPVKEGLIEKFGGVMAIGEVICSGDILTELDKTEIYLGKENKFNYIIWDFSNKRGDISDYLKKRFRSEKLKAIEKQISGEMFLQSGEKVANISSKKLIDFEYFVFDEGDNSKAYFGKIIQKSDYEQIEARDMNKPVRRESLSISPRLSKIMINLSKVKEGGKLVDGFCGVGAILQEALIQNIKVIGVDIDKNAIIGAKQNLEWGNFSKENYKLINESSKTVQIDYVYSLVSEPNLGEILRKMPTKANAKKTLKNFEDLVIDVLNNLKEKVDNRFVFTAPLIKHFKKRFSCNIEKITQETGLKLVKGFPISEFRKDQVVGRDIFVLEK